MSKVKNISGGRLDVPTLGRSVEADEIFDAPDFQSDGVSPLVWPPDKWEPVKAVEDKPAKPAKPAAPKADGASDTAKGM